MDYLTIVKQIYFTINRVVFKSLSLSKLQQDHYTVFIPHTFISCQ